MKNKNNKERTALGARKIVKIWTCVVIVCLMASIFMFGLVRAVGMIMLGFAIVQIGLSLKSHDPSQRANGFLTLAGGVVITFAKEILTLITG